MVLPAFLSLPFLTSLSAAIVTSPIKGNLKGFNYASIDPFPEQFKSAQNLVGATGFASARFYTLLTPNTANEPLDIFGPARDTNTSLLLGLYCSAGDDAFKNGELAALKKALDANKDDFAKLVVGISVGNEDLYRQEAHESGPTNLDVGDTPENIIKYIGYTRDLLKQYNLESVIPVGHCDTWSAWETTSDGGKVIPVVDFVGVNSFPYWEGSTNEDMVWHITNAVEKVGDEVKKHANPDALPPIWVTETGYPYEGPPIGAATPSKDTAQHYWKGAGCENFFDGASNARNIWWFKFQGTPATAGVDTGLNWGVVQNPTDTNPVYDLSCDGKGNGKKRRTNDNGLSFERRKKEAEAK